VDFLRKLSDFFDPFSSLAKYIGLAGVAIGMVFWVFKEIIRKDIFSKLDKKQSYNIIRLIIIICFGVVVLSLIVYTFSLFKPSSITNKTSDSVKEETLKLENKGVIVVDSSNNKK
jgi:hypothetical protein